MRRSVSGKRRLRTDVSVSVSVLVLNSSIFKVNSVQTSVQRKVLSDSVIGLWVGTQEVHDLTEPVQLKFKNTIDTGERTCVFWQGEQGRNTGNWSDHGCNTTVERNHVVCNCSHLSFFAVLVNPAPEVKPKDILRLRYISYTGSALSVAFTAISILVFMSQRKMKSEQSLLIHMQLTGSLMFLHLSFLFSASWYGGDGGVCLSLGLILHWFLLATFTWTAIEGFHLYLLLVRVFNIYIKRYLLKLSLVGWGVPTVIVTVCGASGVYGRYPPGANSTGLSTELCWIKTPSVGYAVVGYLAVVLLCNTSMLGVTFVKMRKLRMQDPLQQGRKKRVWKDWFTVLGLSFVLGLPWGLSLFTYGPLPLPGLYLFTVFNSLQGVFVFLWILSIICKNRSEQKYSSKDPSTMKENVNSTSQF
ncbi:adhesion G protein-coupled receptor G3-like [Chanos chanos]|uniref:Adhesion G protein-coupled receptor G3-like n=1 Tax=Chanos chanos TaxID=29144 RepID=A0A6J2UL53_CHACN|nr:adhesion G protein-coupled receptor G3-like [Chanos chanos]